MDFEEFVKLMTQKNQFTLNNDDVTKAFQVFDRDCLGFISSSDLRMAFKRLEMSIPDWEIDEILQDDRQTQNRRILFKG